MHKKFKLTKKAEAVARELHELLGRLSRLPNRDAKSLSTLLEQIHVVVQFGEDRSGLSERALETTFALGDLDVLDAVRGLFVGSHDIDFATDDVLEERYPLEAG